MAKKRPDLFITMTGTTITRELFRLKDNRSETELVELANRIFALKLKSLMHEIVKKQIFGRVVGRIWVIEYQVMLCFFKIIHRFFEKRGIPHGKCGQNWNSFIL